MPNFLAHVKKTDVSKYNFYLESQAVWPAALKVQLRGSQTLSAPYLGVSRPSGDNKENGTYFV